MKSVKASVGTARAPVDAAGAFSFYSTPPEGEIRLANFESLAKMRLRILQVIDRKASNMSEGTSGVALEAFADAEGANVLAMIPPQLRENPDDEITSHFISRLAFARSPDFVEWFIRCEELLFFCKLQIGGMEAVNIVLKQTGLQRLGREKIGPDHPEFEAVKKGTPGLTDTNCFYVMKFTDVPLHLIARRGIVISNGFAYLPEKEMPAMLTKKFKEQLTRAMAIAVIDKPRFMADERIAAVFKHIAPTAQPSKKLFNNLNGADRLNLTNFHVSLNRSFPPCMRLPVEWMRERKSHLKNHGRNQVTPFLRSAGMTLEDSLSWWKREFSRDSTVDGDKFEKNYTYNIKWTYGKAGRMKPVESLSCSNILNQPFPAKDQSHGCPFKVLDEATLGNQLRKWAIAAGMQEGSLGWVRDVLGRATKSKLCNYILILLSPRVSAGMRRVLSKHA